MPTTTLIGLDIGQMVDYTALALLERTQGDAKHPHEVANDDRRPVAEIRANPSPASYVVRHLQRFELGTSYPNMVERVCAMLQRPELDGRTITLLLDVTGVGRGILDMFKVANVRPKAITIHGGVATSLHGNEYHVSKRDLVYSLTSLSQARPVRLALGERLPFAQEVRQEMQTFTAKINPDTAHESFAAWREQAHDDLLLSMALCTWWGERFGNLRGGMIPIRY
jgi:predicted HAD superfamily phosphohydrolase